MYCRSDSGSSGSSIDDTFWRNSSSPEAEDEGVEDGEEWAFEIVGEEVDADGEVRYEVEWDNWKRADGTSQTWQPMNHSLTKEWRSIQKRRRDAILKDSIDIELDAFSGVDLHNDRTRLRAQAYEEKLALRRKYSPKLEEQMAKLLAEKLGSGADLDNPPSPTNAVPETSARRGLRLTAVRQRLQRTSTSQPHGPSRSQDDASISKATSSSSGSRKPARTMSVSYSESSSRPHALPSMPVTLRQSSPSKTAAVAARGSQDCTSHKHKVSGIVARQKRSVEELETESDDPSETKYGERKRVKRVRITSPQRLEVESEEDEENVVDNYAAESDHDKKSITDLIEDGHFNIEAENVESSDVEMEEVTEPRPRTRSRTVDVPTTCSATVDKEEERTRNTRAGQGTKLRVKYGAGNPCDRCQRTGIVCLSRDQGNSCLECAQKKQKCGSSVQSKSLTPTNRIPNPHPDRSHLTKSKALQGATSKHGLWSEQEIALFTKAINASILPLEQLTSSVDMLSEHVQQLIGLIKMEMGMRWKDRNLESDKDAEALMPERLDSVALLKTQRDTDHKQYKLGRARVNLRQARGVVESEMMAKIGRQSAVNFDRPDFSSVSGGLTDVLEKSMMGQKDVAMGKLIQVRREAEERVRWKARDEKNRSRKGKEKAVEVEEDKSE